MKFKLVTLSLLTAYQIFAQKVDVVLQPGAQGKDAMIFSRADQVAVNAGNYPGIYAYTWTWGALGQGTQRSLLEFDLSHIPVNATITSAKLTLFADNYQSVNVSGHSTLTGNNSSKLKRILSSWEEDSVTWNNQPATSSTDFVALTTSTSSTQNYELDVLSDVMDMINNPSKNHGWMLELDEESTYRGLFFGSSDAAKSSLFPKLEISYTLPVCRVTQEFQPGSEGIDALIFNRSDKLTFNDGNSPYLHAYTWTWNSDNLGTGTYRSLLKFDLSAIPTNAVIDSASLLLFADNYQSDNISGHSKLTHTNSATLYRLAEDWKEDSVTWANQPSFLKDVVLLEPSTSSTENYQLNVTSHIQSMVNHPETNFGWVLREDMETTYSGLFFSSSDEKNAALRPKLKVSYNVCPTVTAVDVSIINSSSVAFFPNPNNTGELSFTAPSSGKILDMRGILMLTFTTTSKVDISFLAKGMYMVQLTAGKTQKLLVD
jgi:hypothetical protein